MKKIVKLLETGEMQSDCELLPYNFSPRNKSNKEANKKTSKQTK